MATFDDLHSFPSRHDAIGNNEEPWDLLHDAGEVPKSDGTKGQEWGAATSKTVHGVTDAHSADIQMLHRRLAAMETEMKELKTTVQKLQQQVAFTAHFIEGGPIRISKRSPIAFSQVKLNLGEGYDPKTGVFTAPVSGLYLFHLYFKGDGLTTSRTTFLKIVKAGSELFIVTLHNALEQYDHAKASASVATHVEAGQKVYVQFEDGAPSIDQWWDTSFTGVLIRAD